MEQAQIDSPARRSIKSRVTAYTLLILVLLAAAGFVTVIGASVIEHFTRADASLQPTALPDDITRSFVATPTSSLTAPIVVYTTHADRQPFSDAVTAAAIDHGGYVVAQDGADVTTYAAPQQMAQALNELHVDKRPRAAKGDLTAAVAKLTHANQGELTRFTLDVRTPRYEKPLLLDVTVAGVLAVAFGIIGTVFTITIVMLYYVFKQRATP